MSNEKNLAAENELLNKSVSDDVMLRQASSGDRGDIWQILLMSVILIISMLQLSELIRILEVLRKLSNNLAS